MENIHICKNCGKEHDGTYGKGNFCSLHCSRSYSGKQTKTHTGHVKHVEYYCKRCKKTFLGEVPFRSHKASCVKEFGKTRSSTKDWICPICNNSFRTRKILYAHKKAKHLGLTKKQVHQKIDFTCQFCKKDFFNKNIEYRTQHENHCSMNPNGVPWKSHPQSEESKKKLSEAAKKNNFGGWHTSKSIDYNGIKLDSSYELTLAQDLDKNNIKWLRPEPFLYKLNGEEHRYYPDFYLSEYNVYVDTKNDYLINSVNPRFGVTDVEKIHLVEQQNSIKIYILDKNSLSWNSIKLILNSN